VLVLRQAAEIVPICLLSPNACTGEPRKCVLHMLDLHPYRTRLPRAPAKVELTYGIQIYLTDSIRSLP
jgi:hypothetical protein